MKNTRPTTRRTRSSSLSDRPPRSQKVADTAHSSESGRTYHLDRLIGRGGFGEVYLATPTPSSGIPAQVCVKITDRLSGWLREAYFAELLTREERALRVFDRFAEMDGGQMRYYLVTEYAEHGDLGVWLGERGAQSERFVRREIAASLGALDSLHRGQAMLLRKAGHHVTRVVTGRQALDALAVDEFDVVLMDVQMPDMDGLEATAEIRRSEVLTGHHIAIIAFTAHAMAEDHKRFLDAGADGYLTKPFSPEQLHAVIASIRSLTGAQALPYAS